MRTSIAIVAVVFGLASTLLACGSSDSDSAAPQGGIGGSCYPNNTCNKGLSCLSKICVKYDSDSGVTDDGGGGTTADGGGSTGDAQTGPTNDAAAAALAHATCAKSLSCWAATGYVDVATCEARSKLDYLDRLTAPQTSWTPQFAAACAAATSAATCASYWGWTMPECQPSPGTIPNGGACGHGAQCASLACYVAADNICGVCGPAKALGATCASSAECGAGLLCSSLGTCAKFGQLGDPCDNTTLGCGYGVTCRGGTCQDASIGAPCTNAAQDCGFFEFCDPNNVCAPVEWAPPGGTCGWVAGDTSIWRECGTGVCPTNGGNGMLTASCQQVALDGQSCNANVLCESPSVCHAGICIVENSASCK